MKKNNNRKIEGKFKKEEQKIDFPYLFMNHNIYPKDTYTDTAFMLIILLISKFIFHINNNIFF